MDSPPVVPLTQIGKAPGQWSATLYPDHFALAGAPGGQPFIVLRDQLMKTAIFIEHIRALVLKEPINLSFKMTPEAATRFAHWMGRPLLAAVYLKRRYSWVLPVALIWIVSSLPMPGSGEGTKAVPFDVFGFALGLILVVSWAFAKWRPHPVLFLVDSLWFLLMAGRLVADVMDGRSKGWLVLAAFMAWLVVSGIRYFIRFRGTNPREIRVAAEKINNKTPSGRTTNA